MTHWGAYLSLYVLACYSTCCNAMLGDLNEEGSLRQLKKLNGKRGGRRGGNGKGRYTDLNDFKKKHGIRDNADVPMQEMLSDGKIRANNRDYTTSGGTRVNVFKENAKYMCNGVYKAIPVSHVYSHEMGSETILVSRDPSDGSVKTVTIVDKQSGQSVELEAYEDNMYAIIQEGVLDIDDLNAKFKFGDVEPRRVLTNDHMLKNSNNNRKLQGSCTEFRVIELAVAYESSFCAGLGGETAATAEVINIVAAVSLKYQQESLCIKVELSHLEGYCDENSDPYKQYVDLNASGCGNSGLLQGFQSYWQNNRTGIARDSAHLFSGTGLECSNGGCVIGCAFVGVMCSTNSGYGVNYVTFTSNFNLRAVLVAHELGHNCDAQHYDPDGHIMNPFVGAAENGFSATTINSFTNHFDEVSCIDLEVVGGTCTADSDCDNGFFCDGQETCDVNGDCQAGTPVTCNDSDVCTTDTCDNTSSQCVFTTNQDCCLSDADCDNGIFCDGQETCVNNSCLTGTPVTCNDSDACTTDTCDNASSQCVNTSIQDCCLSDADCDNSLFCDGQETCVNNSCQTGAAPTCDDGVSCTVDSCDDTNGCINTPIPNCCSSDADCDNGIFCDGQEICDLDGNCQTGTPVDCNDGDSCTVDSCDAAQDVCTNIVSEECTSCGDGVCNYPTESATSCAQDCTGSGPAYTCGNGVCETAHGETCLSCPKDCKGRLFGNRRSKYCCGNKEELTFFQKKLRFKFVECDDSRCTKNKNQCDSDPIDDVVWECGDDICSDEEDSTICPNDCETSSNVCGNKICESGEDCKSCKQDCPGYRKGPKSLRFCCGERTSCSDFRCSNIFFKCTADQ